MSQQEQTVPGSEVIARLLDAGFDDVDVVPVVSGGAEGDAMYGAPGSGKTQIVLRLSLALTDPPAKARSDPPSWAALVRNALVHEGKLNRLVRDENPGIDVDTFLALLAEILSTHQAILSAEPQREFTEAELDELHQAGLGLSVAPGAGAATKTAAEYSALILRTLSVPEAADRLHVDPSRIRQRLADRSLYGIKTGRTWRLPDFQFTDQGLLPGMAQLLPSLPDTLHPVAVQRWLNTALPELELDGEPATPRQWLGSGEDPAAVVEIARDL